MSSIRPRNARSVTTSRRTGEVAVTVAVRGTSEMRAISPMKSPAPSSRTLFPLRVTRTVPSTITMNSRPRSPSRMSVAPSARSSSSASAASFWSSAFEHPAKSGTPFISSTFLSLWRRTGRSYEAAGTHRKSSDPSRSRRVSEDLHLLHRGTAIPRRSSRTTGQPERAFVRIPR